MVEGLEPSAQVIFEVCPLALASSAQFGETCRLGLTEAVFDVSTAVFDLSLRGQSVLFVVYRESLRWFCDEPWPLPALWCRATASPLASLCLSPSRGRRFSTTCLTLRF